MKKYFTALSLLSLTACGLVFSGTSQDLKFDSNVEGVDVFIDGVKVCKTPCTAEVERTMQYHEIIGKKAGYEEKILRLDPDINPISIGNMLSISSWATDLASGGAWYYRRGGVYFQMKKLDLSPKGRAKYKRDTEIRQFLLYNIDSLRLEASQEQNGEYTQALAELTQKNPKVIQKKINQYYDEITLIDFLVD